MTARRLALLLVTASLVAAGCGSSSGSATGTTTAGASGAPVQLQPVAAGATITGSTPCPATDGSSKRTTTFAQAPPTCIVAGKTYTAVVSTTEGNFTISLDTKQAPIAVNNFVVLSLYHFYDGIAFHRIVPNFVDQIGDPTETGSGGPGYDLPDENPTRAYAKGDVAMARAAKVSGSQLFLTIDPGPLQQTVQAAQPAYPIIGEITAGMAVVEKINAYGTNDENGEPTKLIKITSIKISST